MTIHSFPAPSRTDGNSMVQPAAPDSPDQICGAAARPIWRITWGVLAYALIGWIAVGVVVASLLGLAIGAGVLE